MLLNDDKLKRAEELLAVPAAVATLRQLLNRANTPEVRLGAAKALTDIWNSVMEDEEKLNRLIEQSIAIASMEEGAESEQVEQLASQAMGADDDLESMASKLHETLAAPRGTVQARGAPAKPIPAKAAPPAPARNGVQEKPAPASAKTKPKHADEDEGLPRVPVKYWVILGSLTLVLAITWLISWSSAPESAASLANRALTAATAEERAKAAAELASRPKESLPFLRRVAKDGKDAAVLTAAFAGLTIHGDAESAELFLAGMANNDSVVRDAAFKGLARAMNIPFDKRGEFKADDPEDTRTEVISRLRKQYAPGAQ